MSKRSKKLLFSSMIMLLIAVMALTTATFAWFSTGKTAELTDVEFKATAAAGIQISADAATWKSTVSATEIVNEILSPRDTAHKAQDGRIVAAGTMSPSSSAGVVESGALKLYQGAVDQANGTKFEPTAAVKGTQQAKGANGYLNSTGYYEFDLYFYNTGNADLPLYLNTGSTVKAPDTTSGEVVDTGIQNAARISFIDQGHDNTTDTAVALKGGTKAVIWEPNAANHKTAIAQTRAKGNSGKIDYYGIYTEDNVGGWDGNAAVNYTEEAPILYTEYTETSSDDKLFITTLEPGISKITLNIWIEGQDVDCNNAESNGSVIANLKFSVE